MLILADVPIEDPRLKETARKTRISRRLKERGFEVRGGGRRPICPVERSSAVSKQAAGLAPGRPDEGVWAYVGGDGAGLLC
jgi:hypothetical protein